MKYIFCLQFSLSSMNMSLLAPRVLLQTALRVLVVLRRPGYYYSCYLDHSGVVSSPSRWSKPSYAYNLNVIFSHFKKCFSTFLLFYCIYCYSKLPSPRQSSVYPKHARSQSGFGRIPNRARTSVTRFRVLHTLQITNRLTVNNTSSLTD